MKESAQICFSVSPGVVSSEKISFQSLTTLQVSQLETLTAPFNPANKVLAPKSLHYGCEIAASMQSILDLAEISRKHGFKVSVWARRAYSERERQQAELLVLAGQKVVASSRKGPLTWTPGLGCPYCNFRGTVWRYDTLVVREAPSGFQLRIVDHQVTVISPAVRDALEEIAATGAS
jgi:hypothetical protein